MLCVCLLGSQGKVLTENYAHMLNYFIFVTFLILVLIYGDILRGCYCPLFSWTVFLAHFPLSSPPPQPDHHNGSGAESGTCRGAEGSTVAAAAGVGVEAAGGRRTRGFPRVIRASHGIKLGAVVSCCYPTLFRPSFRNTVTSIITCDGEMGSVGILYRKSAHLIMPMF